MTRSLPGVSPKRLQGILGTLPPESVGPAEPGISKDTGIYTSFVPEEYGGGGMGALGHVVLDEEVHKSIVQLPTSPVPMMMIGNCTPEQEEQYLLPSVRGEMHYAFGQTEPEAGSDPGGMMQTRAELDGDDWVLNGTKTFISGRRQCRLHPGAGSYRPGEEAAGRHHHVHRGQSQPRPFL